MPATLLVPLILQYGIPLAEFLFNKWTSNTPVTAADWETLKSLANQTKQSQMMDALKRAGIDQQSPQGQVLLSLVQ